MVMLFHPLPYVQACLNAVLAFLNVVQSLSVKIGQLPEVDIRFHHMHCATESINRLLCILHRLKVQLS